MCLALHRSKPSRTPLFRTAASHWWVMFKKPTREGTLNLRYSVCDFIP